MLALTDRRVPPPDDELCIIGEAPYSDLLGERLLAFLRNYRLRAPRYFAKLKIQWQRDNPTLTFPGLCAEVNSVTGRMRPLEDQRGWSWGDTRALGLWCYHLQKGCIPDCEDQLTLADGTIETVNLYRYYEGYCDHLYTVLAERFYANGGKIPFLVDVAAGRSSIDPRNIHTRADEFIGTHVFAINAFFQYGMWRDNEEAIVLGWRTLNESYSAAHEFRFIDHLSRTRPSAHPHNRDMTITGAVVDVLKTIEVLKARGDERFSHWSEPLVASTRWSVDMGLGYHWNATERYFCEQLDPVTKTPFANANGEIVCDPGHAVEGAGFYAELYRFLPENDSSNFLFNRSNMLPVLCDIVWYVHQNSYSSKGVMFKAANACTGVGLFDVILNGRRHRSAPWWNVREMSAAAIRLYQLTGDERMWMAYRKAFDATYRHYANQNIDGLMIQNLDADTLLPLEFHPATGNLDPLHDQRAREREIETLKEMKL